jgi:pimeloyl-ACP methyl ester carboxylesterase
MPTFGRDGLRIEYWVDGSGYPLTLFAPGGMRSVARMWRQTPTDPSKPPPWIDPTSELSEDFRVISMDQRNAGLSSGPVTGDDGWKTYTSDHLALLDHLDLPRTHVMGGCIGSSYCLSLIEAAPGRVSAAVLQNPIGLTDENRPAFFAMFDEWAKALLRERDDVTEDDLAGFKENMYGSDFVFSVDRESVSRCPVPLLVLAGNDLYHPRAVAEEIASLAPDATLVYGWAGDEHRDETRSRVREFLLSHTP